MTTTDLIAAVQTHAMAHYDADGWHYVVECYSNDELAKLILAAGADTVEQAIAAVHADIAPYHDYCEDIRGLGGCNDLPKFIPSGPTKHWATCADCGKDIDHCRCY